MSKGDSLALHPDRGSNAYERMKARLGANTSPLAGLFFDAKGGIVKMRLQCSSAGFRV